MSHIPAKYRQNYPGRVVDWRWQQAKLLGIESSLDGYIENARRFFNKLEKGRTERNLAALYDEFPALYTAWEIYDSGGRQKAELDARILARESFETISQKMNLEHESVITYEATFFNVLDRLDKPSYICTFAINLENDYLSNNRHELWKVMAYFGGSEVLEQFIYPTFIHSVSDVRQIDDIIDRELQNKILMRLQLVNDNDAESINKLKQLFSIYNRRMAIRNKSAVNNEIDEIFEYFRNTLGSIGWSRSDYTTEKKLLPSIAELRESNK